MYALGGILLAERRIAGALALAAALHGIGWLALPRDFEPAKPARVAMIQGNIPQSEKWDPAFEARNYQLQLALTKEALGEKLDLLLWPEAAYPGFMLTPEQEARYPGLRDSQLEFRDPLLALAREHRVPLVIGALGLTVVPGQRIPDLHNSVFTLTPEGRVADRHDKSVLVPFGEYVPLRALFGSLEAVASGLAEVGDLTPGARTWRVDGLGRVGAEHAPAVLICYEVVYPGVVRQAVRDGARLLLNTTNDAWYGRSSAPHQFLAIAKLRSAEHGLPMLRDANTGVTALIDASGAVLQETKIFERATLVVDVPPARAGATVYTRAGDWPLWASALLLAAAGGRAVVGRRRR
jgi:apolipoprotein N-acyltransferase